MLCGWLLNEPSKNFLICDLSVLAETVCGTGWSSFLALVKLPAVSELFSSVDDCKESIRHLNIYQVVFTRVSFDDFEFRGS